MKASLKGFKKLIKRCIRQWYIYICVCVSVWIYVAAISSTKIKHWIIPAFKYSFRSFHVFPSGKEKYPIGSGCAWISESSSMEKFNALAAWWVAGLLVCKCICLSACQKKLLEPKELGFKIQDSKKKNSWIQGGGVQHSRVKAQKKLLEPKELGFKIQDSRFQKEFLNPRG